MADSLPPPVPPSQGTRSRRASLAERLTSSIGGRSSNAPASEAAISSHAPPLVLAAPPSGPSPSVVLD